MEDDDVPIVLAPAWDDRMWEEVWERTVGQVERHRLSMMLLRREQPDPDDRLGVRLLPELARRWRRACAAYALGWGLFATFWAAIGAAAERSAESAVVVTPWWMALIGTAIVVVALSLRHWIRDMTELRPRR